VVVSLSELEYRLLKTLAQHPAQCSEHEELMIEAWGILIERSSSGKAHNFPESNIFSPTFLKIPSPLRPT
jgi:hypothetical protein